MRISVTQLDTYQRCEVLYSYKHIERLQPRDTSATPEYMKIGRAVASAIESGLSKLPMPDNPEELTKEGLAKVQQCLNAVPKWIWELEIPGVSEDRLEPTYNNGRITLVGRPDLWYLEQQGEDVVALHIVEFKSGAEKYRPGADRKRVEYENWSLQPSRYAVLLRDSYPWLEGLPAYRQHIYLSTYGHASEGPRILVANEDDIREQMVYLASLADSLDRKAHDPLHHFSFLCDRCEFNQICFGYLTGADLRGIIDENYEIRPPYHS